MRVLVLSTSYPRMVGDAGGHFVEAQVRRLHAAGHEVTVLAPGKSRGQERREGATIRWLGGTRAFGWPGVSARLRAAPWRAALDLVSTARTAAQEVRDAIATVAPDRVLAHWLVPCVWPALPPMPPHVSVEGFAHGGDVRLLAALPRGLRSSVLEAVLDRVAAIRCASHSLRHDLVACAAPALRRRLDECSTVELPALELGELPGRDARARRRTALLARTGSSHEGPTTPDSETLAVAIGRLVPDKRFELAIEAVRQLDGGRLVVIGDGPSRAALEARARDLDGRVAFLGGLGRAETLASLAACDVLVHPSAHEGAPTVVREARALGVPVVACAAGDVARWAALDPAIRCVAPTPAALARELRALRRHVAPPK